MSNHSVDVFRVEVVPHPDADRLELAVFRGYQCIVRKGQYQSGDLCVYIPEYSVLPDSMIEKYGLRNYLAGKEKNRVRPIRLRGVLSQGICLPAEDGWVEGQDVAEILGVTKYEPPAPLFGEGTRWKAGVLRTVRYDIQNWKRFPDVIKEGEDVVFTEKIHGTFCGIGIMPRTLASSEYGDVLAFSKGLGSAGIAYVANDPECNQDNAYVKAYRLNQDAIRLGHARYAPDAMLFVLGEVFGSDVQDLGYGARRQGNASKFGFRVFDVMIRKMVNHYQVDTYLDSPELDEFCAYTGLTRVPVLYRGPFSVEKMREYTDGLETVSGSALHIREGIVMRPVYERDAWPTFEECHERGLHRVILKSVSGDYLTRKSGTEYQ